jgi:hypothetical protein
VVEGGKKHLKQDRKGGGEPEANAHPGPAKVRPPALRMPPGFGPRNHVNVNVPGTADHARLNGSAGEQPGDESGQGPAAGLPHHDVRGPGLAGVVEEGQGRVLR